MTEKKIRSFEDKLTIIAGLLGYTSLALFTIAHLSDASEGTLAMTLWPLLVWGIFSLYKSTQAIGDWIKEDFL